MACTTRRGTQFSPFELDTIDIGPPIEQVDIICSRFSIAQHIQEALRLADLRDTMLDEMDEGCADKDDEWEDEALVASRAPTLLYPCQLSLGISSAPPSVSVLTVLVTRCLLGVHSELRASLGSALNTPLCRMLPLLCPALPTRHLPYLWTIRTLLEGGITAKFGPLPKAKHSQAYRKQSPHQIAFDATNIAASFSRWAGPPPSKKTKLTRHRLRTLKALLEDDNDLV
ncbi:hypothetical protein B0H13DRAFT_2321536 [Mycena leptocephala]|nr:hypothetical protein B0H13DRAFT_2321536 [Mycena leptocephala]